MVLCFRASPKRGRPYGVKWIRVEARLERVCHFVRRSDKERTGIADRADILTVPDLIDLDEQRRR